MSMPFSSPQTGRKRPWLKRGELLDSRRAIELAALLRANGGDEILYRVYANAMSAPPAASRLRKVLGTGYHVRAEIVGGHGGKGYVYARARRAGEPEFRDRKLRMDPAVWLTLDQAADRLGVSTEWLRSEYLNTGKLKRHRYARRVVVRTEDVDRLKGERARGGLFGSGS